MVANDKSGDRNGSAEAGAAVPTPADEGARLHALNQTELLDTPPDPRFDTFTRLAAHIFSVPIALVTLLDSQRQWFKSAVGFAQGGETSRNVAFCAYAILDPTRPLVVNDARNDPRFAANPLVTGPRNIRFYAGAPILDRDGHPLGTLCILDTRPRHLSRKEVGMLRDLAYGVSTVIQVEQAAVARRESEENHRWAVTLSPTSQWVSDAEGNILEVGPQMLQQLGMPLSEVRGYAWLKGVPPEDQPGVEQAWKRSLQTGVPLDVEFHFTMRDGSLRWVRSRAAPRRDGAGRIVRWYGTIEDIDARKRAELTVDETRRRLETVLESTTDLVALYDHDWRATYLNRGLRTVPGYDGLLGKVIWQALPDLVGTAVEHNLRRAKEEQVPVTFEWHSIRLDGMLEVHAYPTPQGVSVFMRDVTEQRQLRDRLLHQALHDSFTDLPNRTFLQEELIRRLAASTHDEPGLALLRLGLAGFRATTDALGPVVGRVLIGSIAERLHRFVEQGHVVARLDGADFGILQQATKEGQDSESLAEDVLEAMRQPYRVDESTILLKPHVGLAFATVDIDTADRLMQAADIAMSRARTNALEGAQCFTSGMQRELEDRHQLIFDLRSAIGRGELFLVYQPLVDFPQARVGGFEALMRWKHPTRGAVSPADFIPIAEQSGLMVELGAWTLRRACEDALTWPAPLRVAVNLSPMQFRDPKLVETIAGTLANTGLPPSSLKLEITETVLLEDSAVNLAILHQLRALGVLIVLDDFGTGYSSLSYLQRFPFHKIKIDQSFVRSLVERSEDQAIVRSILGLAKALKIGTTAEGVETSAQMEWLAHEGCGQMQGYLLGRPMPVTAIESYLAEFTRPAAS